MRNNQFQTTFCNYLQAFDQENHDFRIPEHLFGPLYYACTQPQIMLVAICLTTFGAHMKIHNQLKILLLIKWSHRSALIVLTLELKMANTFSTSSSISSEHMSFRGFVHRSTPSHKPLNYRFPDY